MFKRSFYVLPVDLPWVVKSLGIGIPVTVEVRKTEDPKKSPCYREEYADYVEPVHFKVTTEHPIELGTYTELVFNKLVHPYPEDMLVLDEELPMAKYPAEFETSPLSQEDFELTLNNLLQTPLSALPGETYSWSVFAIMARIQERLDNKSLSYEEASSLLDRIFQIVILFRQKMIRDFK